MAVSSDDFNRYCRAIEAALGSCATPKQVEKIATLAEVMANGSTLEARNAARNSIAETLQGLYSRSANLQAAAVDDFCRSVLGISPSPMAFSMPKEQALQQIGYIAGELFENGDARSFSMRACDWVTKKATPVANQKMEANCERAYGKGKVRYALVPAGGDICTFCIMLASRGFVYKSGVKFKTHDHCTCKLMPNTKGAIDGYDPDAYYDKWKSSDSDGTKLHNSNVVLKKDGDPAFDYFGPITDEQFEDIDRRCRAIGVKYYLSEDSRTMGYFPFGELGPGHIRMPKDASYSAWRHEIDHAEFDLENGRLSAAQYINNKNLMIEMEVRAYNVEISLAKEAGFEELVKELEAAIEERIKEILGENEIL